MLTKGASMEAHRRHDISDRVWNLLEPHLPGRRGIWGGIARDNRTFINAVFWILRTGAPWRDLPPDYGGWCNTHRRCIRWRNQGVWERLLEVLIDDLDYEWLVIDASHCKVQPSAAGAKGGNQSMSRTKGGSTQNCILPWMCMACWISMNSCLSFFLTRVLDKRVLIKIYKKLQGSFRELSHQPPQPCARTLSSSSAMKYHRKLLRILL